MDYSISIDHELKLIRYTHCGLIKAEDIGQVWKEFLTIKEFTELKYNLFSDYSNSKLQIDLDFATELIKFLQSIESIIKKKKQALIVTDPHSVALSMIFERELSEKVDFNNKIFSTREAALEWLQF